MGVFDVYENCAKSAKMNYNRDSVHSVCQLTEFGIQFDINIPTPNHSYRSLYNKDPINIHI